MRLPLGKRGAVREQRDVALEKVILTLVKAVVVVVTDAMKMGWGIDPSACSRSR